MRQWLKVQALSSSLSTTKKKKANLSLGQNLVKGKEPQLSLHLISHLTPDAEARGLSSKPASTT
jgi:hypothetical protein